VGSTLVGSTLGRFRVDRLMGRGGMGAVYAAFDEKLERDVALKVLTEEGDYALQKKRLLREARLAAKLQHPNIATVYEVDELEGRLLIVMELLEGSALRKVLMQRKVSLDEAISIARDVARALARAHTAGVIHRDIKPENIFLTTPSPDAMLTKVLDFGLARQRPAEGATEEQTATTRGDMWGTPGYVSPEQAHGQPVDVRTDIFSFGVVFYEMLAGIKPFRGEHPIAIMLATTKQEARPLREIFPGIPAELDEIVRRCMKKDREARFKDGNELSAALENYIRGSTVSSKLSNVVASNPSLPFVALDDRSLGEISSRALAEHAPTTGGSAAMELPDAGPPSLAQQRIDHMKIVASIGGGVAVALVVTVSSLAWVSGPARSRTASSNHTTVTAPPSAPSAPNPIPDPDEPPSAAAADSSMHPETADPAPIASGAPTRVGHPSNPVVKAGVRPNAGQNPGPNAGVRNKPADCAQPFTYDKGVKIPKLHCL
jgi:serine/threonine protein kinase